MANPISTSSRYYFAYGSVFVSAVGFNTLGRPIYGLVFALLRSLALYAQLVAIGAWLGGLTGFFIGVAASNIITGLVALLVSEQSAGERQEELTKKITENLCDSLT